MDFFRSSAKIAGWKAYTDLCFKYLFATRFYDLALATNVFAPRTIYRRNRPHLYNVPERFQTNVGEELGPAKMASPTTPYPDKPKLSTITD